MRRLKSRGSFLRRITATAFERSTATVVVFTPPAVEPGAPPTSISTTVMARLALVRRFRSTVLNPAVRGVTAWNRAARARSFSPKSEKSFRKNTSAGRSTSRAVAVRITLLCIR